MSVSEKSIKLFEGQYDYFRNGENYAVEFFHVDQIKESHELSFSAELLSRLENGEVLKVTSRYQFSDKFIPKQLTTERHLGPRWAKEQFCASEPQKNSFTYEYNNDRDQQHRSEHNMNGLYFWVPACFSASFLFSQQKKFDSISRHPYLVLRSCNEWEYSAPPKEQTIFVEFKTHDVVPLEVKNQTLEGIKCWIYSEDNSFTSTQQAVPLEAFLSRNMGLPYYLKDDEMEIVVQKMQKFRDLEEAPKF